ncbi:MAG TPA: hypothetical protein VHB25_12135 [Gemmatimonadaceae bacterium]|nr:hypothetical protein [Gemmatimonadaceae bacterium]
MTEIVGATGSPRALPDSVPDGTGRYTWILGGALTFLGSPADSVNIRVRASYGTPTSPRDTLDLINDSYQIQVQGDSAVVVGATLPDGSRGVLRRVGDDVDFGVYRFSRSSP